MNSDDRVSIKRTDPKTKEERVSYVEACVVGGGMAVPVCVLGALTAVPCCHITRQLRAVQEGHGTRDGVHEARWNICNHV